ncbi:MAG: PHP domain-containing protein [Deltaproteobacteria bacterium]|nr:PHP domain-containing protein [Deltaproteobacteria bacterium]
MSKFIKNIPSFSPAAILAGDIPAVDFHLHTVFTDGEDNLESYVRSAVEQGLSAIAFPEHVTLDEARLNGWFLAFLKEVDRCREVFPDIKIFKGVEARVIDFQGRLNFPEHYAASVDFVMGVVHRYPGVGTNVADYSKEITPDKARHLELEATLAILENPQVSVIGHVGGVYLKKFGLFPLEDFARVIQKAAQRGVAFEINSRYHQAIWKELLELCAQHGARVTLGSDAHKVEHLGDINRLLVGQLCIQKK